MSSPQRIKGSRGENECVKILNAGNIPATRRLQLGKPEDAGDIDGLDGKTVSMAGEVKAWADVGRAITEGLSGLDRKAELMGADYGVCFVKLPRGRSHKFMAVFHADVWDSIQNVWLTQVPFSDLPQAGEYCFYKKRWVDVLGNVQKAMDDLEKFAGEEGFAFCMAQRSGSAFNQFVIMPMSVFIRLWHFLNKPAG